MVFTWTALRIFLFVLVFLPQNRSEEVVRNTELELEDKRLRGYLVDWLSNNQQESKSYGLVLSGYQQSHLDAVEELIQAYVKTPVPIIQVDCSQPGHCADILSRFSSEVTELDFSSCTNRTCKLPLAVFYIKNGQLLSSQQLDRISRFFRQTECNIPDIGFWSDCSRILFVISTNFGSEFLNDVNQLENVENPKTGQPFSVSEYCGEKIEYIQQEVHRHMRVKWATNHATFNRIRQSHPPRFLIGSPDPQSVGELVAQQEEGRKRDPRGRQVPADQLPFPGSIDLTVFDREGFVGQKQAVAQVKQAMSVVKNGLKTGDSPLVFLLVGPPGTGKTFMSELIGRAYHGGILDTNALEREHKYKLIAMGNYQTKEEVDGFVGPRPGLQGSGILTDIFSKETRPVIVLDEIEKSHPSLLEVMLLPILDNNGQVLDKKSGKRFPTRDAIFIMTTNCFDHRVVELTKTFGEAQYSKIVSGFSKHFTGVEGCPTAHNPNQNPFKEGAVRRRLKNGHKYANDQGFILFLPNSASSIESVVNQAMKRVHLEYKKNSLASGHPIDGVYWTRRFQSKIQSNALTKFNRAPETTSLIVSSIETLMIEPINRYLSTRGMPALPEEQDVKCKAVLFLDREKKAVARVYCGVYAGNHVQWIEAIDWNGQDNADAECSVKGSDGELNRKGLGVHIDTASPAQGASLKFESATGNQKPAEDLEFEESREEIIQRLVDERVAAELEKQLQPYLAKIEELEKELYYWKSMAYALMAALAFLVLLFVWKASAIAWFSVKVFLYIAATVVALLYVFGFHQLLQVIWQVAKRAIVALVMTAWPVILPIVLLLALSTWLERNEKRRKKLQQQAWSFYILRSTVQVKTLTTRYSTLQAKYQSSRQAQLVLRWKLMYQLQKQLRTTKHEDDSAPSGSVEQVKPCATEDSSKTPNAKPGK